MKKFFQNKIKLLISLTFLILFVFNTVAYSGLATKLAITSEAMFRPITDIRVTDIKLDSATNGAVESYSPKFNVDTTTTGFVLPNVNSTITYKVKVTNYGNVNQTIYNFIKNSINSSNVNIKITDFTSVCADDSCSQKNSDFTIIHHNGDNTTDSNEKEILITFSTSAPSDQAINVIEKYDFRPIYNINYDANGGQNAPKSQIKIYKDNLTLTTDEPTRPSYKFLGWSTSSKSTTAEYKAGDSYNPGTNEEVKDIILYAVWQKKQAKLDLNYNIDGTWYYSGYNNKIQTGIKVNGEDKGYLNDFDGTYDYGTIYEIYGFKIDGVTIPYSKKYTVDGTNHLGISFNTINFKVNDTNLGSVTPTQLIVIPETTFTISSNVITLSDGRIATASTKDVTGYKTKFSSYTITPNSTTINAKTTAQANFTKEAEKYTITLDNKNATTAGTTTIYEKYNTGIYLDSALTKVMTTSANAITKPTKEPYTISFNANNTGATVPSNYSFSPVFNGYYTATTSNGTQMIDNRGYITNNLTSTKYTSNTTLYAQWNHYYTLPSLSKGGNTCKWAIGSASGTKYNSGTSLFINDNKVFYAVCTPKSYTVTFNGNGGTSSLESKSVTYGSAYGTLPTATRSNTTDSSTGKTISYVFEGWYTAASGGTKIESTTTYNTVGNQILYAHWLSSPNIKGGTAESWSSTAVTISLNIPSTSDTGTVSYQYYLSETNELPESATWIDITSADGSVSISKNGEFYIFYKATSSAGVSITSNYNKLQIDTQTPSTSITAYQAGTTTTVASNKWINKNLEFKMGALNVGPSGGSIYYCIGDSCTPNTLISPNTAIPADLTNTKTGIYKVRYKAVSNAGLSSSIGEYVAKVDKTAPTMKAVVKSLKDNSILANLTNSSTTYIDSTWRSYGYSINLNGTTDSQSGISSIERFTNANNLKRADADYKANLHKGVITDTKTFSESGDGAKYAKFVATDNAGNTATFIVEVLIDKTAPTVGVNIYKAKDASTKTGSVICSLPNGCDEAFKWTSYGYYFDFSPSSDELSGIDYYTMRYTAGGKSSVDTSSYEERNVHSAYTTVTSSGARRLEFTATDKAGNTSTYVTKNIYIDMNDPNLVIKLYKADSSGNKTGSVLKTITDNNTAINSWTNYRHYFDLSGSSDSLSGIENITMQINDSGIVTTGNTATGTSDLKTTYTITSTKHQVVGSSGNRYARFTITDKVGNTSVKNVRIYIDLDAPTLNSASLSPQFQSSTTIKYTCSDKTSGFASFGTKTLSKTYTKNVTSSNSPVKIQCKDTAGNTSSGTRTYTWSANSDKCGTTTEDVYSNGYYCDAGNAASANSSACISYATNTGKTTKYVNKRCMYYCNAKTGTTTVAKTCWHQ